MKRARRKKEIKNEGRRRKRRKKRKRKRKRKRKKERKERFCSPVVNPQEIAIPMGPNVV